MPFWFDANPILRMPWLVPAGVLSFHILPQRRMLCLHAQ
jgi:hypothetical protein